jgi:signal transduction histidine kinase/ligand-binding sensor domain-containing protein
MAQLKLILILILITLISICPIQAFNDRPLFFHPLEDHSQEPVLSLLVDGQEFVWRAHPEAISIVGSQPLQRFELPGAFQAWCSSQDSLWILTEAGLLRKANDLLELNLVRTAKELPPFWGTVAIEKTLDGQLLLASNSGLFVSNAPFNHWQKINLGQSIPPQRISLCQDELGRIWLAEGNDLWLINKAQESATKAWLSPSLIYAIVPVDESTIWLGTQTGLIIFDTRNQTQLFPAHLDTFLQSLRQKPVHALRKDHRDRLWGLTENSVFLLDLFSGISRQSASTTVPYNQIVTTQNGRAWLLKDGRTFGFHPATESMVSKPPWAFSTTPITKVQSQRDQRWALDQSGVLWRNTSQNEETWQRAAISLPDSQPIRDFVLHQESLWLLQNQQLKRWQPGNEPEVVELEPFKSQPASNIFKADSTNLWITNQKLLVYWNPTIKGFRPQNPTTEPIQAIVISPQTKAPWILTSQYLIAFAPASFNQDLQETERYPIPKRFQFSRFNDLILDQQERVWVASDRGLLVFESSTSRWYSGQIEHGIAEQSYTALWLDTSNQLHGISQNHSLVIETYAWQMPELNQSFQPLYWIHDGKQLAFDDLDQAQSSVTKLSLAIAQYDGQNSWHSHSQLSRQDKPVFSQATGQNPGMRFGADLNGTWDLEVVIQQDALPNQEWKVTSSVHFPAQPFNWTWLLVLIIASLIGLWLIQRQRHFGKSQQNRRIKNISEAVIMKASHELRTPLEGLMGLSEHLLDSPDLNLQPKHRNKLTLIKDCAQRLEKIIDQFLNFTALERNLVETQPKVFPPNKAVEDAIVLISSSSKVDLSKLTILNQVPQTFPEIHADEEHFYQILQNLLSNAVKFCNQGEIVVRSEINGTMASFSVFDSGPGISHEEQQHIFEPFRQGDDGTARAYSGSGLGLSICKLLVELNGGEIHLESDEGQGAIFRFSLPLAQENQPTG